jgi:hypothetical protein
MRCPITGDAYPIRIVNPDGADYLYWRWADPETHIAAELLDELDEAALGFLFAKYELFEACPHQPNTLHARRRDTLEQP